MLSSNSDVDHPLCEECTDQLLELLDQQLHLTDEECNDYSRFLDRLQADQDPPHSLESLEKELAEVSYHPTATPVKAKGNNNSSVNPVP